MANFLIEDTSVIRKRLEQHADAERELGSLPDLLDSTAEGISSYAGAATYDDEERHGSDEEREEDRGKENRGPDYDSPRKGFHSNLNTPVPKGYAYKQHLNRQIDSPNSSLGSVGHESYIVALNDQTPSPNTSSSSFTPIHAKKPIISTPVTVRHVPRTRKTSEQNLAASSSSMDQGTLSTVKPRNTSLRSVRTPSPLNSSPSASSPNLDSSRARFATSLSRRHELRAGSVSPGKDERSLSVSTILPVHFNAQGARSFDDSRELPEWQESDADTHPSQDDASDFSSSAVNVNWVADRKKRPRKTENPPPVTPQPARMEQDLEPLPSPYRDDVSVEARSIRSMLDSPNHSGSDSPETQDAQTPRLPSLSRSTDPDRSESDTSSVRATDTPDLDEHPANFSGPAPQIATPSKDSYLRRSVSFTPGGLDVVQEEGESFDSANDLLGRGNLTGLPESTVSMMDDRLGRSMAGSNLKTPMTRRAGDSTGSTSQYTTPGMARHLSRTESPLVRGYLDEDMQDEDDVEDSLPALDQSQKGGVSIVEAGTTPRGPVPRRSASESPAVEKSFMRDYVVTALDNSTRKNMASMSARRSTLVPSQGVKGRWSLESGASSGRDELIATPEMEQDEAEQTGVSFRMDHSLARSMHRSVITPFHRKLMESRGLGNSIAGTVRGDLDDSLSNQSFISIASSADLTSDRRGTSSRFKGNTSLPGIGLDDIGNHEDRAQGSKIAKHLHHMNEQLTAENRRLNEELTLLQDQLQQSQWEAEEKEGQNDEFNASRSQSLDRSKAESSFVRVTGVRNETIMRLQEQIANLEETVRTKEDEILALQHETDIKQATRGGREDHNKLTEMQDELALHAQLAREHEEEIDQLRQQLTNAKTESESQAQGVVAALETAAVRERDLAQQVQKLQWEKSAVEQEKERLRQVLESPDLDEKEKALQQQAQQLEEQVKDVTQKLEDKDRKIEELMDALSNSKDECADQTEQLESLSQDLEETRQQLQEANSQSAVAEEALQRLKTASEEEAVTLQKQLDTYMAELDKCYVNLDECEVALQEIDELKEKAAEAEKRAAAVSLDQQANLSEMEEELAEVKRELHSKTCSAAEIQANLDLAEAALGASKATVAALEAQLVESSPSTADVSAALSASSSSLRAQEHASVIESLRERLALAQNKIDELQQLQLRKNPAYEAELAVRDTKIQSLTTEKEELQSELRLVQAQVGDVSMTPRPRKTQNAMAGSPFSTGRLFNKHFAHIKTPQTPQTPGTMPEFSFLDQSGINDDAEQSVMIRFQEMQAELQEAHKRFDGNFDRLEKANLTTWQMAERLAEEKNRVAELEKHIIETKRRIEISNDRLTATKCPGCDIRFDASKAFQLSGEEDSMFRDSTPRKSGANRDELGETLLSLKTQYEQLQEQVRADRETSTNQQQEITRLQHTLRSAEHAASTALKQAESEHERKLASLRREKQTLETDHNVLQNKLERTETNLRETQAQVRKVQQQLREVRNQLTQSEKTGDVVQAENVDLKEDLARISTRLVDLEQRNSRSSAESQVYATEQNSKLIASKTKLEVEAKRLTEALAVKQRDYDLLKIQLSEKTRALGAAENKLANKSGSSTDLQRELKVVEDALNQHKRDTEKFGQAVASLQADREKYRVDELELQSLRKGKTDADRMIESLETEISDLENNLGRKERELEARLARSTGHDAQTEALRTRVADLTADRKKLTAQVRYLRAKFARENTFRNGLMVQKHYLLRLVGRFRQSERETLALIASMGYPSSIPEPAKPRTFKAIAVAVRATIRMKRAAAAWSNEVNQRNEMLKLHSADKQQQQPRPRKTSMQ